MLRLWWQSSIPRSGGTRNPHLRAPGRRDVRRKLGVVVRFAAAADRPRERSARRAHTDAAPWPAPAGRPPQHVLEARASVEDDCATCGRQTGRPTTDRLRGRGRLRKGDGRLRGRRARDCEYLGVTDELRRSNGLYRRCRPVRAPRRGALIRKRSYRLGSWRVARGCSPPDPLAQACRDALTHAVARRGALPEGL